jgi:predicted cupin superfamily sugar epimerase
MTGRTVRRAVDGTVIEELDVPVRAAALHLEPHPEGGWYRRTWTSPSAVRTTRGDRPAATMILFLLPPGEASAWPDPVVLELGGSAERPEAAERIVLGPDRAQGHVPAGVWQRTLPSAGETLVSCVVSPGFDFADFALEP